jgi:hypothetical protein
MTTAKLKRFPDCGEALKDERERRRELLRVLAMKYRMLIAETKDPTPPEITAILKRDMPAKNTIQTMNDAIDSLQKVKTDRECKISRWTSEFNAPYETTGAALTARKDFPLTPNAETTAAIEEDTSERREERDAMTAKAEHEKRITKSQRPNPSSHPPSSNTVFLTTSPDSPLQSLRRVPINPSPQTDPVGHSSRLRAFPPTV